MSLSISAIKQKLTDAVRTEYLVLQLWSDQPAQWIDWSAGSKELWELWRRELREIVAPPPRPNVTNFDEARNALDLLHRAVEALPDSVNEQSDSATANRRIEWTVADSPTRWAKLFGFSLDTFKRRVEDKKIRVKKLSPKSYMVAVDDLPAEHQAKYRPPKKDPSK